MGVTFEVGRLVKRTFLVRASSWTTMSEIPAEEGNLKVSCQRLVGAMASGELGVALRYLAVTELGVTPVERGLTT